MPLQIESLTLRKKDIVKDGSISTYVTPYTRITQYGYGRIYEGALGNGLCTDGVASCTSVVFHCSTTKRTALTHSPNFLLMSTFIPIVDWVAGGVGKPNFSMLEQAAFFSGMNKIASPCEIDAVVLLGYAYATPQRARFGHESWMADFRRFCASVTQGRGINVHIDDGEHILSSGAVLVDKGTGKITMIKLAPVLSVASAIRLRHTTPDVGGGYSVAQEQQNLLSGGLLVNHRVPECPPLNLQFDVSKYCLRLPLTDEGRQLLRSKRLNQKPSDLSAIIRSLGLSENWTAPSSSGNVQFRIMKAVLESCTSFKVCERCPLEGGKTCSACKGAWYCSDVHQREDWKAHKHWCRQHHLTS